jgi:hypothetical protein
MCPVLRLRYPYSLNARFTVDPIVGIMKASGAYYIRHKLPGLVDYTDMTRLSYIWLLPDGD